MSAFSFLLGEIKEFSVISVIDPLDPIDVLNVEFTSAVYFYMCAHDECASAIIKA